MDSTIIGFTVAAWLIHSLIAGGYSRLFDSPRSPGFRITHAFEIFITVLLTITLYKTTTDPSISTLNAIATVLGTLIILDGVSIALVKKLRQRFDFVHYILAYTATALAVALGMQV